MDLASVGPLCGLKSLRAHSAHVARMRGVMTRKLPRRGLGPQRPLDQHQSQSEPSRGPRPAPPGLAAAKPAPPRRPGRLGQCCRWRGGAGRRYRGGAVASGSAIKRPRTPRALGHGPPPRPVAPRPTPQPLQQPSDDPHSIRDRPEKKIILENGCFTGGDSVGSHRFLDRRSRRRRQSAALQSAPREQSSGRAL